MLFPSFLLHGSMEYLLGKKKTQVQSLEFLLYGNFQKQSIALCQLNLFRPNKNLKAFQCFFFNQAFLFFFRSLVPGLLLQVPHCCLTVECAESTIQSTTVSFVFEDLPLCELIFLSSFSIKNNRQFVFASFPLKSLSGLAFRKIISFL